MFELLFKYPLAAFDKGELVLLGSPPHWLLPVLILLTSGVLALLLAARRSRAANLLRYGSHLSTMLIELAREIAGPEAAARAERLADPDYPYKD